MCNFGKKVQFKENSPFGVCNVLYFIACAGPKSQFSKVSQIDSQTAKMTDLTRLIGVDLWNHLAYA